MTFYFVRYNTVKDFTFIGMLSFLQLKRSICEYWFLDCVIFTGCVLNKSASSLGKIKDTKISDIFILLLSLFI